MLRISLGALVLLISYALIGAQDIQRPASFIVGGETAERDRYPSYVSLRYRLITTRNRTAVPKPYCGATLISDRLILTAAHCACPDDFLSYYAFPRPTTYRPFGLNFSSFPNTYVISSTSSLSVQAFVGAQSRQDSGNGIPVAMWFVHPWYDPESLHYDIAVGLLQTPVPNVAPMKLYNPASDVYEALSNTTNITAIGMGDTINEDYDTLLSGLNASYVSDNNDTNRPLKEVVLGTLANRVLCGKFITATQQMNSTDIQSGNTKFGTAATVVSLGQLCVGTASDDEIEANMWREAYRIVGSANTLPPAVAAELKSRGIDYNNYQEVKELLNGYNDTCQGDSGGPILIKGATPADDVQIGIVSYGVGCGSGVAGVYTSTQGFLNEDFFDGFLYRVLQSVPSTNGQNNMASLVRSIPNVAASAG